MKLYKGKNGNLFSDTYGNLKVLGEILSLEEVEIKSQPLSSLVKTGVYKNGKELTQGQIEQETEYWRSILETLYGKMCSKSQDQLVSEIEQYRFFMHCSYRGGEKYSECLVSVFENPYEKVADELDWVEY